MLPQENRLNLAQQFRYLKKEGKPCETAFFTLLYRPSKITPNEPTKIGFVVSNRLGNAVVRNRIRRLLREIVQFDLARLPQGLEIVIIAKKYSAGANLEELTTAYHKVLPKISSYPHS